MAAIDNDLLAILGGLALEGMVLRAVIRVPLPVIREVSLREDPRSPGSPIGERDVGLKARVLDGGYVLDRAVGGVPSDLLRPHLTAEAHSPQQVLHRHVLHDVRRGDQRCQDDAPLAPVDHVVVVVARAVPCVVRIGVGQAQPEIRRAHIAAG